MTEQQGWEPSQQPPWEQAQQPSGASPWQQPYGGPQWQQGQQQAPGTPPPWQGQAYGQAPWQPGQQPHAGRPPAPGGPQYPGPNAGGRGGGRGRPPKKSHRVRNTILGIVTGIIALFVVAGVIGAATGTGKKNTGDKQPVAGADLKPKPTPSPTATLTASQQAFVNAVEAAYPNQTWNPPALAKVGQDTCNALTAGESVSGMRQALRKGGMPPGQPATFINLAVKDICPNALPKVLLNMTGSGIQNSAPFMVSGSQVTVTYSFNCASAGGSGNFIADLEYGNQSSPNSDDQSIANQLAPSGQATTTVYPQDPGNDYYVSVDSECSWTITVES
jgi:hypothetical protein